MPQIQGKGTISHAVDDLKGSCVRMAQDKPGYAWRGATAGHCEMWVFPEEAADFAYVRIYYKNRGGATRGSVQGPRSGVTKFGAVLVVRPPSSWHTPATL